MNVSNLIAWAKSNAKEGVNVAEFEEMLIKALPPETSGMDKEAARNTVYEYVKSNPSLRSAWDANESRLSEVNYKKFTEEKLPDLEKALRDKLAKEMNPSEDPKDAIIRELKERADRQDREVALEKKKAALRAKASEIGFDPTIAETFAGFGDEAENQIVRINEYITSAAMSKLEAETKKRFNNPAPIYGAGGIKKAVKDMTPDEAMQYAKQGDAQRAEVLAAFKK